MLGRVLIPKCIWLLNSAVKKVSFYLGSENLGKFGLRQLRGGKRKLKNRIGKEEKGK